MYGDYGIFCALEIPESPGSFSVDEVTRASGRVNITASWTNPQNIDRFEIARYEISVSSTSGIRSMLMADGQSTRITRSLIENSTNVEQMTTFVATIAAVNDCSETGDIATDTFILTIRKYFIIHACHLLPRLWCHMNYYTPGINNVK